MRGVAFVGSAILISLLFGLSYFLNNFWIVFFWPAVVLLIVQTIAMYPSENEAKDKVFVLTDFIYYIGIGAILGLLSHYLPHLENVLSYDARKTYDEAVAELPAITRDQEEAASNRDRSLQALEAIDPGTLGSCMIEWQTRPIRELGDGPASELSPFPPGCEIPLGVLDAATRDDGALTTLTEQKRKTETIVTKGPSPPHIKDQLPSEDMTGFLLYQLFPCLLLCGVALKVGKTTHSFLK